MYKAVITADIIHSTRISPDNKEWLYGHVKQLLNQTSRDFNVKTEMYRGDSFQALVHNPKDALRIALIMRLFIRSLSQDTTDKQKSFKRLLSSVPFDVRMTIGIGSVDMEMENVSISDGTAFQLSGKMLDDLKHSRSRFAIKTDDLFNSELGMESKLLDVIINKTSSSQCEVMYLKLLNYTEVEIASKLNIVQSAVNQRSVSGSWNVINDMVEYFEKLYDTR